MSTLVDRLNEVMLEMGMKKNKELARFCSCSESLVAQWFSGQTQLGPKPLKAFSKTNYNLAWLAEGTLPKYRNVDKYEDHSPAHLQVAKVSENTTTYGKPELIYATPDEVTLLTQFRECTVDGQEAIWSAAKIAERDEKKILLLSKKSK